MALGLAAVPRGSVVSLEDVKRAAGRAGDVPSGDIVLGRLDYDGRSGSNGSFEAEAIAYLVSSGIKMTGVDLPGMEVSHSDPRAVNQHNHHQLPDNGICLVKRVATLAALRQPRVFVFMAPAPMKGLDTFPIFMIAMEEI